MSTTMNTETQAMMEDISAGHVIDLHNARELVEISRAAQAAGNYDARFEDRLTAVLKHSIDAGVYRRTSLPTPPPANIITQLRNRV